MPKATKKSPMTLDQLKKEDYLLVFMLNHEDSTSTPFNIQKDGRDFLSHKGTKNIRSLQSMLQTLKRKGLVVNGSPGNWLLTFAGVDEAKHCLSKCGLRRYGEIAAAKSIAELQKENMELKEKLEKIREVLNKVLTEC